MYAIVYIFAAFTLLAYFFSPDYREKTNERWKRTPKHRVINEIGAGIIGLALPATIAYFIISAVEDSNQN
jgi:amino acid transporter